MFCYNCGAQLPDEATFCWKCGKPQKQGVQSNEAREVEESKFETCQINYVLWRSGAPVETFKFVVEAVGPEGKFYPHHSDLLKWNTAFPQQLGAHRPVVDSIVNKLVQEGWEPVETRGDNWYNLRFRRPISLNLEFCEITHEIRKKGGFFGKDTLIFRAKVTGPKGPYDVAESLTFEDIPYGGLPTPSSRTTTPLNALKERIRQEGWQEIGTGIEWCNVKFRRQIK